MKRALFLDRDGTLIVDTHYPRDPALVQLLPGVGDALRRLQQDFRLVVISNQSGIARKVILREEAEAVHARFVALFAAEGVAFAGYYYCPHGPEDGCACRKPQPGMLHNAAEDLGLDLRASIVVGDKRSDLEAGAAAGCRLTILYSDWPAVASAIYGAM